MNHLKNAQLELQAAFELGEVPPSDTLDRALWRARFVLSSSLYDEFDIEPQQALGDLMSDLVHLAAAHNLDIDEALEKGKWMANEELNDWSIDPNQHTERITERIPEGREISGEW